MKYKNQLLIGSSILAVVLALFIGARLLGNEKDNSTIGKTAINKEIDNVADDGILDKNELNKKTDEKVDKSNEDKETSQKDDDSDKVNRDQENKDADAKTTSNMKDEEDIDDTNTEPEDVKKNPEEKQTDKKEGIEDKNTSKEDTQKEEDKQVAEKDNKETSKAQNVIYVFKNKYVVQPKETLSDIVKKCLIANKLEATNSIYIEHARKLIEKINNIADPNLIISGTQMIIPTKANFKGLLPNGEAYVVKTGDTIHDIVKAKMSWCEYFKAKDLLMKNNNISNENEIKAGITIYIPEKDSEV